MDLIRKILSFPIILLVKIYQWIISPIFPAACRYNPTCSHYMIDALKIWGPFKGTWLGLKRIGSCHPWGGHGDDPVPEKKPSTISDTKAKS
jgi:putative membrane protein insertion efficiency factor